MKVLVTGHKGYIGVHVVDLLKEAGHTAIGCDLGLFDGCELDPPVPPDREIARDIRAVTPRDLDGMDCVMHLAALSNDPMGEVDTALTYAVNLEGSLHLARVAKEAGVPRFLFSSSCSIYGKGAKLDLDESDSLNPVSAYARSKIETENGLRELASDSFSPCSLRNATAYGYSPMLRLDLVVNNLLASALAYGEIRIMSDGSPWRPLVHCRDIGRAFLAFMEAPREAVHNTALNVGDDSQNFQVRDIAALVQRTLPAAKVVFTNEVGADPRDYRVRFTRLHEALPDFRLEYTLERGIEELYTRLRQRGFGARDFEGDRFIRLRTLRNRLQLLQPVTRPG